MSTANQILEIERIATSYMNYTSKQLEERFFREWKSIKKGEGVPIRGDIRQFWRGVANNLKDNILKNRDVISVTMGYITAQVLAYLETLGVDLIAYKIPVALFVALVAKSVFDQLEAERSRKS